MPPEGSDLVFDHRHNAAVSVLDSGVWVRQLPELAEPLVPLGHKAQLTV
jgi:hypothetical protein